jgi:hypothetical protein
MVKSPHHRDPASVTRLELASRGPAIKAGKEPPLPQTTRRPVRVLLIEKPFEVAELAQRISDAVAR